MDTRKNCFIIGLLLLLTCFLALPVLAYDYTYTGADEGNWGVPGNWISDPPGGTFPNSDVDSAWINNNISDVNVFLNGNYTVHQLTIDSGDSLTVNNGILLYFGGAGAAAANHGTILLNSTGSATFLYANGVDTALNGTGSVTLGGDALHNYLQGTSFTNNSTIQGGGFLQPGSLTNNGQIIANNKTLQVNTTVNNGSGVMSASGSGNELYIYNCQVTGGQVNPGTGQLTLNAATLTNTAIGAGQSVVAGNSHLKGTTDLAAGATLTVSNSRILYMTSDGSTNVLNNGGTVLLDSSGATTLLYANGTNATLNGGSVTLGGDALHNYLQGTGFTNNSTIQGGGFLQPGSLTNNGQIIANNKTLQVNTTVDNSSGVMSATSGNELYIYNCQVTGGQVNPGDGQLTLNAATLTNTAIGAGQSVVAGHSHLKGTTVLAAGVALTVNNGVYLYMDSDGSTNALNNGGTVLLDSSGSTTYLGANGTIATLNSPGSVTLGGDALHNYLGGTGFINNSIIQGGGFLQAPITNNGQIIANNKTLRVDNGVNNSSGVMSATSGNELYIYNCQVTGGQVNPGDGQLTLNAATLINTTVGSGQSVVAGHSHLKGTTDLAAGVALTVNNGVYLYMDSDGSANVLNNGGDVLLKSTGSTTYLVANGTIATLNGPGSVTLGGDALHNYLGGTGFINNGIIQGGGYIQAQITNNGQIIANHKTLQVNAAVDNSSGAMSATSGNQLYIYNCTVTGGQINPGDGQLTLYAATLTNTAIGAGQSVVSGHSHLRGTTDLAAGATLTVSNGQYLYMDSGSANVLNNSGEVRLNSTGSATYLIANGTIATLNGPGSVTLGGDFINNYLDGTGFINNSTIQGGGYIQAQITNNGTLRANNKTLQVNNLTNFSGSTLTGGTYVVDGTGTASTMKFAYTGYVETNNADITLKGSKDKVHLLNNSGADLLKFFSTNNGSFTIDNGYDFETFYNLDNSGTVTVGDASLLKMGGTGVYSQWAGLTRGTGAIQGVVTVYGGTVKPGLSPGTLTVNGYFDLAEGTFLEEISGSGNGLLQVIGNAISLGPNAFLDIDLLNGFNPTNKSFTIMTQDGLGDIYGVFANAPEGTPFFMDGYDWTIAYNPDSIVLYGPTAPLPGTGLLLGSALLGLAGWRARRR